MNSEEENQANFLAVGEARMTSTSFPKEEILDSTRSSLKRGLNFCTYLRYHITDSGKETGVYGVLSSLNNAREWVRSSFVIGDVPTTTENNNKITCHSVDTRSVWPNTFECLTLCLKKRNAGCLPVTSQFFIPHFLHVKQMIHQDRSVHRGVPTSDLGNIDELEIEWPFSSLAFKWPFSSLAFKWPFSSLAFC